MGFSRLDSPSSSATCSGSICAADASSAAIPAPGTCAACAAGCAALPCAVWVCRANPMRAESAPVARIAETAKLKRLIVFLLPRALAGPQKRPPLKTRGGAPEKPRECRPKGRRYKTFLTSYKPYRSDVLVAISTPLLADLLPPWNHARPRLGLNLASGRRVGTLRRLVEIPLLRRAGIFLPGVDERLEVGIELFGMLAIHERPAIGDGEHLHLGIFR